MFQFGKFEIYPFNFGNFRLDGGAMFGSVPKNLWSQRIKADDENCIKLATRSLFIKTQDRLFLLDVGMGEKWTEKQRKIFAIENTSWNAAPFKSTEVTDIILTHLHFDHAGGISKFTSGNNGPLELVYPQASVYVQADNLANAKAPNIKERASYLTENVQVLSQAKLSLTKGSMEVYPDIWVHQVDGHTVGQQWVELKSGKESLVFPTDLVPTSHHLPLPFHMGYDICAATVLKEREDFLEKALKNGWIIVFQHDADLPAARIMKDLKGHFAVKEFVGL